MGDCDAIAAIGIYWLAFSDSCAVLSAREGFSVEDMAEDAECPKPAIEEACKPECIKQLLSYQQCVKRIEGKPEAHCTGQYFDYWHCIDHCTAPRLFSVLK